MMSDPKLADDQPILTPLAYWQETLAAWTELGHSTRDLWLEQTNRLMKQVDAEEEIAETLTRDILRTVSDFNLRHWQNTARALDAMPDWMQTPKVVDGTSITDWFDRFRRRNDVTPSLDLPKPKASTPAKVATVAAKVEASSDDLTRIKGIGPKLSKQLNELGVYNFKQIAGWTKNEATWIDENLSFKGRIDHKDWVKQARKLISNGSGATLH